MTLYEKIRGREEKLSLIGLGYVGMPVAVAHKDFRAMTLEDIKALYRQGPDEEKVLLDIKGIFSVKDLEASKLRYWRL